MTVAERTYSFRAPGNFGRRLQRSRDDFLLIAGNTRLSDDFGREFPVTLLRRFRRLDDDVPDGVLVRSIADAFASATERVRSEHERVTELAAIDEK